MRKSITHLLQTHIFLSHYSTTYFAHYVFYFNCPGGIIYLFHNSTFHCSTSRCNHSKALRAQSSQVYVLRAIDFFRSSRELISCCLMEQALLRLLKSIQTTGGLHFHSDSTCHSHIIYRDQVHGFFCSSRLRWAALNPLRRNSFFRRKARQASADWEALHRAGAPSCVHKLPCFCHHQGKMCLGTREFICVITLLHICVARSLEIII